MTSQNFCYWLQGCLELNPEMTNFSTTQWKCVEKHLSLALTYDNNPNGFVRYMEGVVLALDGNTPSLNLFNKLKQELSATFIHEVDNTQGDLHMQHVLSSIHNNSDALIAHHKNQAEIALKLLNDPREELPKVPTFLGYAPGERC